MARMSRRLRAWRARTFEISQAATAGAERRACLRATAARRRAVTRRPAARFKPRGRSSVGSIRRAVRRDAPETRDRRAALQAQRILPPSRRSPNRTRVHVVRSLTRAVVSPPRLCVRRPVGRQTRGVAIMVGQLLEPARGAGAEPPSSVARRPRPHRSKSARPAAGDHRDALVVKRAPRDRSGRQLRDCQAPTAEAGAAPSLWNVDGRGAARDRPGAALCAGSLALGIGGRLRTVR